MTKYEPLKAFLAGRPEAELSISFHEIESIIAASLPPSAFKHRAWWSNNPSNSVITYAWLAAGYETARVDMELKKLIFRRAEERALSSSGRSGWIAALQAELRGTVHVEPGYDLTEPTGETWDAER